MGYLNFLTKVLFAGRTFTRRMYAKFANNDKLKKYHHVCLDAEFKLDCKIWQMFLLHYQDLALCRPMVDLNKFASAIQLSFSSDASANKELGAGAVFGNKWWFVQWERNFINECNPSIEYLELFGLVASILTWGHLLINSRFTIYCDNQVVVGMVNKMSSSCCNCMHLIRLLALNNLINNRRIFVKYISSQDNYLADSLSRLNFKHFWRLASPSMEKTVSKVSPLVWPLTNIWLNN